MAEKEKILMRPGDALQYQALPNTPIATSSYRSANAWIKMAKEADKIAKEVGDIYQITQGQRNEDAREAGILAQTQGKVLEDMELPKNPYERDHLIMGYQLGRGNTHISIYESQRRRAAAIFAQDPEKTDEDYVAYEAKNRQEYITNNLTHPTAILAFTQGLNRSPQPHFNIFTHGNRTAQSRQKVDDVVNAGRQDFSNLTSGLSGLEEKPQLDSFGKPILDDKGQTSYVLSVSEATQEKFQINSEEFLFNRPQILKKIASDTSRWLQKHIQLLDTDEKVTALDQMLMDRESVQSSQVTDALANRQRSDYEEEHKELVFYYDLLLTLKKPSKDGKGETPLLNSAQSKYFSERRSSLIRGFKQHLEVMEKVSVKSALENNMRWAHGRPMGPVLTFSMNKDKPDQGQPVESLDQMQLWADQNIPTGEVDSKGIPIEKPRIVVLGAISETGYNDKVELRLTLNHIWNEKMRQEIVAVNELQRTTAVERIANDKEKREFKKSIRKSLYSIKNERGYDALFARIASEENTLDPKESKALSEEAMNHKSLSTGLSNHGKIMATLVNEMTQAWRTAAEGHMKKEQETRFYEKIAQGELQPDIEDYFNRNPNLKKEVNAGVIFQVLKHELDAELKIAQNTWRPEPISQAEINVFVLTRMDGGGMREAAYQGGNAYIEAMFRTPTTVGEVLYDFSDKTKYPQIDLTDPNIRAWSQAFEHKFNAADALPYVQKLKELGWEQGMDFPANLWMRNAPPPHLTPREGGPSEVLSVPSNSEGQPIRQEALVPISEGEKAKPEGEETKPEGEKDLRHHRTLLSQDLATKSPDPKGLLSTPKVEEVPRRKDFSQHTFTKRIGELEEEVDFYQGRIENRWNTLKEESVSPISDSLVEPGQDRQINMWIHLLNRSKTNLDALRMAEGEFGVVAANNGYNNAHMALTILLQGELGEKGALNDPDHPFHIYYTELEKWHTKAGGSGVVNMDIVKNLEYANKVALFGTPKTWKKDDRGTYQPVPLTPQEIQAEVHEQYDLWKSGQAKEGNVFFDISKLKDFGKVVEGADGKPLTAEQVMEEIRNQQLAFASVPKLVRTVLPTQGRVRLGTGNIGQASSRDKVARLNVGSTGETYGPFLHLRSSSPYSDYYNMARRVAHDRNVITSNAAVGYRLNPRRWYENISSFATGQKLLPLPKQDINEIIDSLSAARRTLAESQAGDFNHATFVPLIFMNPSLGRNIDHEQYINLVGSVRPHMKPYVFQNPKETDPTKLEVRLPSEIRADVDKLIRAELEYHEKQKHSGASVFFGPDIRTGLKKLGLTPYETPSLDPETETETETAPEHLTPEVINEILFGELFPFPGGNQNKRAFIEQGAVIMPQD